jgi:uncharacterized membrane protein
MSEAEPGDEPARPRPFERALRAGDAPTERDVVLDRMLFFSDAVFAIAMTLLVVDLRPPELGPGDPDAALVSALRASFGQILGFAISFLVIALYWDGHLRIFRPVRRADRGLIGLNLAFLVWIAFMPFPTSILGGHDPTRGTVIFYAAVQIGAGLFEAAVWWYATAHPRLIDPAVDPRLARLVRLSILRGPVVFAISIPIALILPWLGIASWALLIPSAALVDRRYGRVTPTAS